MSASKLRPHRRRVQIVFQDPYRSMNPRITIGESIIEGPMNFGLGRGEALARARKLMETVRLDPNSLDRYPHQSRAASASASASPARIAMEPELLIADEAVSALDVYGPEAGARAARRDPPAGSISRCCSSPTTSGSRRRSAITVAVMSKGRVVEYGSAEQVFGSPKDEYTKALFAAAPGRNWNSASSRRLSRSAQ